MVIISDIMHKDVFQTSKDATCFDAVKELCDKGVSCLAVTENGSLEGIITRRDIFEKLILSKKNPEAFNVSDIMSSPAITVNSNATLIAASGLMKEKGIKQLPVVDEDQLVGVITQTDLVMNINKLIGFDQRNA